MCMLRDGSWGSQCSAGVKEKGSDSSCCAQHAAQPATVLPTSACLSRTKPFSQGWARLHSGPRQAGSAAQAAIHRGAGTPAPLRVRVGSCQITPVLTVVKAALSPAAPCTAHRVLCDAEPLFAKQARHCIQAVSIEGFTWNHTNPSQIHTLPLACSIPPSAAGSSAGTQVWWAGLWHQPCSRPGLCCSQQPVEEAGKSTLAAVWSAQALTFITSLLAGAMGFSTL